MTGLGSVYTGRGSLADPTRGAYWPFAYATPSNLHHNWYGSLIPHVVRIGLSPMLLLATCTTTGTVHRTTFGPNPK